MALVREIIGVQVIGNQFRLLGLADRSQPLPCFSAPISSKQLATRIP
ncbi:MAG: hypothetical protein AVDCRST_MAG28-1927 [uncultured Rubrobacteraceae bacterium]|uniref:Uncharacterized protein n=1 Tax=uncultured Rubrobacteraceae bacterium TaxID=349277 RepID=A0A6J4QUI2_9ACTN|nr:MAG: hypothetical protein AVDCRST_MAG28-1927 [uncultured Rubrobacteraceae bacterium]